MIDFRRKLHRFARLGLGRFSDLEMRTNNASTMKTTLSLPTIENTSQPAMLHSHAPLSATNLACKYQRNPAAVAAADKNPDTCFHPNWSHTEHSLVQESINNYKNWKFAMCS